MAENGLSGQEIAAIHELMRPIDGHSHVLVTPIRYPAFRDMQAGDFGRDARLRAALKHGHLWLADSEDGAGAVNMTMDNLEEMLGSDAAAVADLIAELMTPDDSVADTLDGDGIEKPLIYKLRFPVQFDDDAKVTHLEFFAKTYKDMRHVWMANDPFEALLRVCAKPVHTGGYDMPISDALINALDGYDLAAIAAYVVPVFTAGGGRSKILRRP